jgi:hypothetical protein
MNFIWYDEETWSRNLLTTTLISPLNSLFSSHPIMKEILLFRKSNFDHIESELLRASLNNKEEVFVSSTPLDVTSVRPHALTSEEITGRQRKLYNGENQFALLTKYY